MVISLGRFLLLTVLSSYQVKFLSPLIFDLNTFNLHFFAHGQSSQRICLIFDFVLARFWLEKFEEEEEHVDL
jgi:hypothetical protein